MRQRFTHTRLTLALRIILVIGFAGAIWEQQWLTAVTTLGIMTLTLFPRILEKRYHVFIPPAFELLAIAFLFASLFLGEVRGYYARFWWWDMALHTASGFLLGILGFLLVHVLNELEDVGLHMKAGFVAFFAFLFAVGAGALWEIFEFSMDELVGTTMQKPMFGDPSGLTDTMWDLIVDALGASIIAVLGYGYLTTDKRSSFLQRWIRAFIEKNPGLFQRPN